MFEHAGFATPEAYVSQASYGVMEANERWEVRVWCG